MIVLSELAVVVCVVIPFAGQQPFASVLTSASLRLFGCGVLGMWLKLLHVVLCNWRTWAELSLLSLVSLGIPSFRDRRCIFRISETSPGMLAPCVQIAGSDNNG